MCERQGLTDRLRAYLATPRLQGSLALQLAGAPAGAMVIANTVVYVQSELSLSASHTAGAFAAAGLGSLGLALAIASQRSTRRLPQPG